MRLIWSKTITERNMWQPYYKGIFCKIRNKVHFFYKGQCDGLRMIAQDQASGERFHEDKTIPLPRDWNVVDDGQVRYLFFKEDTAVDLSSMAVTNHLPASALSKFKAQQKSDYYYSEESFHFDEYTVSHKGNWGYLCTKNGQKIWEFSGHAYLYTDIMRWNNRLYFGTAGQGGYFYILDLETGEPLTKVKTGGTTSIVQNNDLCYVLRNDEKAKLICLDLHDGFIKDEIELSGKASDYSSLQLIDGKIHATTFEMKNDILRVVYWSCVEI